MIHICECFFKKIDKYCNYAIIVIISNMSNTMDDVFNSVIKDYLTSRPDKELGSSLLVEVIKNFNDESDINNVRLLLDSGADPNTSLLLALESNHNFAIVQLLLEYGADVNITYDREPLLFTWIKKDLDIARMLLCFGANISPNILNYAIRIMDERLDIIELLIDFGVDLSSCLLKIPINLKANNIEFLIKAGANLNMQNKDGWSVSMLLLVNRTTRDTYKIAKLLIESGANLNVQNSEGWTVLMLLLKKERITEDTYKTVKLLIKSGANLNVQIKNGWTALMLSLENRVHDVQYTYKITKLLIKSGASLNVQNSDGWNALMFATKELDNELAPQIVELLLNNGALLNIKNKDGWTALMLAAERSNADLNTVNLLLNSNLNLSNNHGSTALHYIIKNNPNNFDIISKFIELGSDINIKNNSNESPLSLCNITIKDKVQKLANILKLRTEDTPINLGTIPICVICMENMAIIIISPCNHLLLCSKCCIKNKKKLVECPLCKNKIDSYILVK